MLEDLGKCYEDPSIFVFHIGCLQATGVSHISTYLTRLLRNFKEVGVLFDPEPPNSYSRISQLVATYDSYPARVEPESTLELVLSIYPFPIDLRITTMCSHESIIRRREDGLSSHGWLRCDLDCRCIYSSLNYSGIIQLCL